MNTTSKSLLLRAITGDQLALDKLLSLCIGLIRATLHKVGVSDRDIDDLAQDVVAKLLAVLPTFKHAGNHGSLRRWLRTTTRNQAFEFFRANRSRPAAQGGSDCLTALAQLEDPNSDLTRFLDDEYEKMTLQHLLELVQRHFEPTTWKAFCMVVLEEKSVREVSSLLGLNPASVYAAKSRVMQRLRAEADGIID